jgi:pimeloyl-ACP methyl ester carboxylesterase
MKSALLALLAALLASASAAPDKTSYYNLHIIAVDRDGSALWPGVELSKGGYKAKPRRMDGELLEGEIKYDSNGLPRFRTDYYVYVSNILEEIRRVRPKRIVFYIHGGMNFITGAIAKGAQLADDMRDREDEEYRISICWSSNLFSTYGEHLTGNVEGLSRPLVGLLTSPLTLLSDVGGAIADTPRTLVRLLSNDLHAAYPISFQRDRRAFARETELEVKRELGMEHAIDVSLGADERTNRPGARAMDAAAWIATQPAKIATAPIIDQFGSGAWQMMERRTRTMFERETSITTRFFRAHKDLAEANRIQLVDGRPTRVHPLTRKQLEFNERASYAGRLGAVRLFFEMAEQFLVSLPKATRNRTEVILIGHSMGAIVSNEILARFINIDFDKIVFFAAACSVNDFARVGVPYLRQHPRAMFYNVCLHPSAERAEAQPGRVMLADPIYLPLEVAPRGSLLVWIDSFLAHPESENDRTLGRWENAVLVADAIPMNILNRMTLKALGRDRGPRNVPGSIWYTTDRGFRVVKSGGLIKRDYLAEPAQHGEFTRFRKPNSAAKPNFDFTRQHYWKAEKPKR